MAKHRRGGMAKPRLAGAPPCCAPWKRGFYQKVWHGKLPEGWHGQASAQPTRRHVEVGMFPRPRPQGLAKAQE